MKPFDLWKRMITGKVYTKEQVILRVNTVFAVGQLTPDEYTILMDLIGTHYLDKQ